MYSSIYYGYKYAHARYLKSDTGFEFAGSGNLYEVSFSLKSHVVIGENSLVY